MPPRDSPRPFITLIDLRPLEGRTPLVTYRIVFSICWSLGKAWSPRYEPIVVSKPDCEVTYVGKM